jgi:hypothetical protein
MRATGGAIVPEKYFWYLIDFATRRRNLTGQRQILDRLSPSEARRTLEVPPCSGRQQQDHTIQLSPVNV